MILENVEVYYVKLDRPNNTFSKSNPTWEVQCRTTSKEQKKEWEAQGLSVKPVVPDDDSPMYFKMSLRKNSIKKDGTPAEPPECVNGDKEPIDPNTVGNGSICNIRVYQYDYMKGKPGEAQIPAVGNILMGIQVLKHLVYTPAPRIYEEFGEAKTETIVPEKDETEDAPF